MGAQAWPLWALGLSLMAGATAVLYCFDPSSHGFYPTCLFHQATGLLCPGCGCLRAVHQLLHGNVTAAFHFNPWLVLSLPVLAWFLGWYGFGAWERNLMPTRSLKRCFWAWLLLGLVFSVWRNIPGSAFGNLPA
ncbi:MAG TPA: DUF2752 domain-containing protein [Patescibacteria group bacterium]|jgi:hypothetical protein|nr:DUF2752 domain-containing protein [Patescibacteria group bacterium]